MEKEFFVEDIKFGKHIKGDISNVNNLGFLKKKLIYFTNKKSISYFNIGFLRKFNIKNFCDRDLLIYLCLLLIRNRYVEIFDILKENKSKDPIFKEIIKYCNFKIKISIFKYILYAPIILFRKVFNYI